MVIHGTRTLKTPLCTVSPSSPKTITTPTQQHNTMVLGTQVIPNATIAQRIAFLHATLGNYALSAFCGAINDGFLTTLSEITMKLVRKYPPAPVDMVKGHFDQIRRNQQTTHPILNPPSTNLPDEPHSSPPTPGLPPVRTHAFYVTCIAANGQIFTDQTGHYPIQSTAGNSDISILYDYDSNIIHDEPIPSCTGYQIMLTYNRAHKILTARAVNSKLQQ